MLFCKGPVSAARAFSYLHQNGPESWPALTSQGRFYRSRMKGEKKSGNGAAFPQATERVRGEQWEEGST